MLEFLAAVMMTLCYIWGLRLRYAPFKKIISREKRKRLRLIYGISLIVNVLIVTHVFHKYGVFNNLVKYNGLVFALVMALTNKMIVLGKWKQHLFVFGITTTCGILARSGSTLIGFGITGYDDLTTYMITTIIYGLLLCVVFYPVRKLLRYTVEPFLELDIGDYWTTLWFIPVGIMFSLFFTFPSDRNTDSVAHLLSGVMVAAATIMLCLSVATGQRRMAEKQIILEQLSDQKLYYAQLQSRVEEARRTRHDFKHHITAVQQLAAENDVEGIQDYCSRLVVRTNMDTPIPYTGNAAVDGVIYRYMLLSREHNIRFVYNGSIKSGGIADIDLCVLLGNALENALAGCLTIETGREITVVSENDTKLLSVVIQNTFDGKIEKAGDQLLSRKRDSEEGFGMSSMQTICSRYHGTMETRWDESTFTVLFLLPVV